MSPRGDMPGDMSHVGNGGWKVLTVTLESVRHFIAVSNYNEYRFVIVAGHPPIQ